MTKPQMANAPASNREMTASVFLSRTRLDIFRCGPLAPTSSATGTLVSELFCTGLVEETTEGELDSG
jgi:hypothetical protein